MKVSVDDVEIFTMTDIQKQVIQNDIPTAAFDADMKRRLQWILIDEKYGNCFKRLKTEWEPKLAARGMQSLPTDPTAFAQLVFSQPDYKNRDARDVAAQASFPQMPVINP